MTPLHVPLFVLLLPLATLLPAAAASSQHTSPASTHAHLHYHGHNHRSLTITSTARKPRIIPAPSMHQNDLELEESKSLLVLEPFTPVAAQAPSGEEAIAAMAAAATAAEPTLVDPPQAASPPPSLDPATDLTSLTPPPQPQAEMEWSGSPVAAPPPLDEPAASTTTLPVSDPYNSAASPPVSVDASVEATTVSSADDNEIALQQLAKILTSLGYNEMASTATLLADSPSVAGWTGAITVFAAPDVFLQTSCSGCSRRRLFLEHIALGYFPVSELAAAPTVKLPSASIGFCLNVAAEPGPFVLHHVNLNVDGIEVSHPELYNDGRFVVHGLHGFVPPLSHTSCYEAEHHHRRYHLTAKAAAGSSATAASVVRIMIRDAISRLRDGGFGFVALAMRIKFAELEKFANLTVFALDDLAIFTGRGHDYVSSVRFHIVPEHRLTRANLLQLRPGTKLPTLAGKYQKLVITHGAGSGSDEVRINYIPVKEPDAVVNSRVAIHGIYVPFPRLHLASLASSLIAASTIEMNSTCVRRGPFGGCASTAMASSATIPTAQFYGNGQ
jgi:hypothetical protein